MQKTVYYTNKYQYKSHCTRLKIHIENVRILVLLKTASELKITKKIGLFIT